MNALKSFLRSPRVIVGELVALALLCSLGAALPQIGTATPAELARWYDAGPFVTAAARLLALDHVFRSGWFLLVTALTAASLTVIVFEQARRFRSQWSQRLSLAHFHNAPFRTEYERDRSGGATPLSPGQAEPRLDLWTERRIGLLGSPLFHVGLLLIIAGGALRAVFSSEAVVDLVEGETLLPNPAAWAAQWPGVLGRPFHLDGPLTLDTVTAARYDDGDLRELNVRLSLARDVGSQPVELAVNRDLRAGGNRVFLGSDFGPAALLEWQASAPSPRAFPEGRANPTPGHRQGEALAAASMLPIRFMGSKDLQRFDAHGDHEPSPAAFSHSMTPSFPSVGGGGRGEGARLMDRDGKGKSDGSAAGEQERADHAIPVREAALLAERSTGTYEGVSSGPGGLQAYLRAQVGADGARPELVEIRVMKEGALLFTGDARVGQTLLLRNGVKVTLQGTPLWVRLRGSRDPALGLTYLGFAFVVAGAVLIFAVVKVDVCVSVTPLGERERVLVALKPQRFTPLFQERFELLVREVEAARGCLGADVPLVDRPSAVGTLASAGPRLAAAFLPLLVAIPLAGCQRSPAQQAHELVEHYNDVVSEAYRRGDAKLIDPVVGPNEGRKITGLIGVRLDLGLTLDAELLGLEVTGVQASRDELEVTTKERWRYRDRRIGTGEVVGEESTDSYEMVYFFKKPNQRWLVDEIRFTAPPQVGRRQMSWVADRSPTHDPIGTLEHKEELKP